MSRAVVLGALVMLACGAVEAPGPARVPNEVVQAPKRELSDTEIQVFVLGRMSAVATALDPLCGHHCHGLGARPDPELQAAAALGVTESRPKYVLLYRLDQFRVAAMHAEAFEVATYAIAHELGHYIDLAVAGSDLDDRWRREISAELIGGCAIETLGLRDDLIVSSMRAAVNEEAGTVDSRLELVCGSDPEHPASRWMLEAFDTGERLCRDGIVPLAMLEEEVEEIARDARRAATEARKSFSPHADPCLSRR